MTPAELRAAIQTLWPGHGGQTRAARHFGIDSSRIRAMLAPHGAANHRRIPEGIAREITDLLAQFPDGITNVDPRKSVAILHQQMQAAGWRADEAAAGILGAAVALARSHVPADQLATLIRPVTDDNA